jgi:nucleotide-binding universal stress UspA family protein
MNSVPFRTILVGVNGTPDSERALQVAISLAQNLQARLIVLGVVPPLSAETEAEGVGLDEASEAREQLQEQLLRTTAVAQGLGIDFVTEIVRGDPEKEIERRADRDSIDLIVVGHRDVGRFRYWLEGSTSETLVR